MTQQRFNVGTTAYGAGVIGISIFAVVFSMLHVKHAIGFTNFFVWWLTVIGWILTGLTFIIYVFSRDLCSAKENIDRTGGVRQLLPCISPSAGQKALNVTYAGIYQARWPRRYVSAAALLLRCTQQVDAFP